MIIMNEDDSLEINGRGDLDRDVGFIRSLMSTDRQPQNDSSRSDVDRDDETVATSIIHDNIDADVNDEYDEILRLTDVEEVKRETGDEDDSKKLIDKEDELRRTTDICRICHMGGFPQGTINQRGCENEEEPIQAADSQMSNISSYAYLGPLISACKCRGTVALVHAECLERWLTESGHTSCELCGHRYATKRVPRHNIFRSLFLWVNTVIATRQMLLDILYLLVTTPLAVFSCYICLVAIRLLIKSGIHDVPWMMVAILPTCFLTLAAYWGWLITLGRLHGRRWRRYWRSNFVIQLLPQNINTIETLENNIPQREVEINNNQGNIHYRNLDNIGEFVEIF